MSRFFILIMVVYLSGCATVTSGTTQEIKISEDCHITQGDKKLSPINGVAVVNRSNAPIVVSCENQNDKKIEPKRNKKALVGNFALDFGLITGLIDHATGAIWEYEQ